MILKSQMKHEKKLREKGNKWVTHVHREQDINTHNSCINIVVNFQLNLPYEPQAKCNYYSPYYIIVTILTHTRIHTHTHNDIL